MKFTPTDCIYCNTGEIQCSGSLDTSLTISLDGDKVVVKVCEAHADDASVKTAKEQYLAKKVEFDQFLAQAAKLGISLGQSSSGLVLATAPEEPIRIKTQQSPQPQQAPQRRQAPQRDPTIINEDDDKNFIDLAKAESISINPRVTAKGDTSSAGQARGRYSLNETKQQLAQSMGEAVTGKVKLARAPGRRGAPVLIPVTTVDSTGTTNIRLANNLQDNDFQRRFKDMAENSINGGTVHFANGYNTDTGAMECPLCNGTSEVRDRGMMIRCPKCDGAGVI